MYEVEHLRNNSSPRAEIKRKAYNDGECMVCLPRHGASKECISGRPVYVDRPAM